MFFEVLDSQEHQHYEEIAALLSQYDSSKSPTEQEELLSDVLALHQQLQLLQETHANSTCVLLSEQEQIWVKRINTDIIPTEFQNKPMDFLTQEYQFFVNTVLNTDNIAIEDKRQVNSLVLKIMSRPQGQRLICQLNNLKRENNDIKIHISLAKDLAVPICEKNSVGKITDIKLNYPENYHKRNLTFHSGKDNPLIHSVSFISFAHELMHILHHLQDNFQRQQSFPAFPTSALYQLYFNGLIADKEEFHTIEDESELTENSIRKEHDLPLRNGHHRSSSDDINQILKIILLVKMKNGEKNFSTMFFSSSFKPPQFLNMEGLAMPKIESRVNF